MPNPVAITAVYDSALLWAKRLYWREWRVRWTIAKGLFRLGAWIAQVPIEFEGEDA